MLETPKGIKVQANFNGLFGDVLCLSHGESRLDEFGNPVTLRVGMMVTAFEEDYNDQGERDDLMAHGVVELSPRSLSCNGSMWVLRIDARGVRHESEMRFERGEEG